jgi:hypothetical protein
MNVREFTFQALLWMVWLQSLNTPTQLASMVAAILAVERFWLMAPMVGTPFSFLSLPRSVAPSQDATPPPNGCYCCRQDVVVRRLRTSENSVWAKFEGYLAL